MRRLLVALMAALPFALVSPSLHAQGAPARRGADAPYAVEYYYKTQWGHQKEFLDLFLKNHFPLLRKLVDLGRVISVKIETPAYHTTEDGRWDYRVTIVWKNSTIATTEFVDEGVSFGIPCPILV